MLAARDQENLAHAHQTTAAGKPLNQGIRSLQPKTPGNVKTPFRQAKNDENRPLALNGQKTALKDGGGKLDKSSFVTPMGPRTRAPLGMKTTNAKTQAFKTPGPAHETIKIQRTSNRPSVTRKSIKSKITIAPTEPVETDVLAIESDDDVPDIEYAPPPPIELPDPPMEFPYDQTFPQFQGRNMFRGIGQVYGSPKDEHGNSLSAKKYEEMCERYDRDADKAILDSINNWSMPPSEAELNRQVDAMIARGPKIKPSERSKIETIKAKTAVSALSQPRPTLAAAKPTASSLQKKRKPAFAVLGSKPESKPTNPSPMRHTASAVISRNTIGYPKARKPASIVPRSQQAAVNRLVSSQTARIDQSSIHPKDFLKLYGEPPAESDMWFRLREYELLETREAEERDADGLQDQLFGLDLGLSVGDDEDCEELFQLAMPD